MDRLPDVHESLLSSLLYMQDGKPLVDMASRFNKLTIDEAQDEGGALQYLRQEGFIYYTGLQLTKSDDGVNFPVRDVRYPRYVAVTQLGKSYFKSRRSAKIDKLKWTMLGAVLSGLCAWLFSVLLPG